MKQGHEGEDEIAAITHHSIAWVRERVAMLEWPAEILAVVHGEQLSVAAARNLARIEDAEHRKLLLDYAIDNGATAAVTAAWFQSWQAGVASENPGDIQPLPERPAGPPIEPYTPCVICGRQYKMIELRYTPICGDCGEELLSAARRARSVGGEVPAG